MKQQDNPTIRTFDAADQVPLRALILRTIDRCYRGHYCAEAVRFFKDYHSEQAIRRDAQEGCTIVLDRAGQILATGTLVGDEIKRVFVDPACQRQGLGRLVMRHLEERAAAVGRDGVRLDASLPSKAFYDRLGYATVEPAFLEVENGRRLDFFRMRKILITSLKQSEVSMANDREQTAYCGLYCEDCIPANQSLFETAAALRQQLDDCQFERYAEHKSTHNRTFDAYPVFREVLDAILALRCPKTCFHGGGNPHCAIRACARQKALEGCWQCEGFETCETLQILCTCHGDTVKHNLRMIRQHGVENWSHTRGRHYTWQRSNPQQRPGH